MCAFAPAPQDSKECVGPIRRCAWTRQRAPQDRLFRMVLAPDGTPHFDLRNRAPGRGLYLSPDREVLQSALTPKGLGRLFRGQARSEGFADPGHRRAHLVELEQSLTAQIQERVGLARRAQQVVMGAEPVLARAHEVVWVALATDLSPRTRSRIEKGFDRHPEAVLFPCGSMALWGQKLGTKDVGVIGLLPSTLAKRLAADADRHRRLTNTDDAQHGAMAENRNEKGRRT